MSWHTEKMTYPMPANTAMTNTAAPAPATGPMKVAEPYTAGGACCPCTCWLKEEISTATVTMGFGGYSATSVVKWLKSLAKSLEPCACNN